MVISSAIPWLYEALFAYDEGIAGFEFDPIPGQFFVSDIPEADKDLSLDLSFFNSGYVFCKVGLNTSGHEGSKASGDIFIKGRLINYKKAGTPDLDGKIFSNDLTFNSNPVLPVRASFNVKGDELKINALRLGKPYELKGVVSLIAPHKADVRLEIDRADMRSISKVSKIKNRDVSFGIVSGSFDIKGSLVGNMFSKGVLESRSGKIGPIEYDLVKIRLEGFGPIINIVDSSFKGDSGMLTMEGYVDLRNALKGELFEGIAMRSDLKTIVWRGWDITKKGSDELRMEKDVGDNMRVGFKTMARDYPLTYHDEESPEEMSLEYKMGQENLKMELKDNEEFFGVEHSIKF